MTGIPECPCGTIHELSADARAAYALATAGKAATVRIELEDGRAWMVPRIWLAAHGLKAAELPALADRYGFEPAQ